MISINDELKEILAAELARLIGALEPGSPQRQDYAQLLAEIENGEVTAERAGYLEKLLDLLLSSGVARQIYGPPLEMQLARLYRQTPAGEAARRLLDQVNQVLANLQGQQIVQLSFALKAPGLYQLSVQTEDCELSLNIDKKGITVDKLSVDI